MRKAPGGRLPISTPRYGINYQEWIDRLRRSPGDWFLVMEGAPRSLANSLRVRKAQPWVTATGRVQVSLLNSRKGEDGRTVGDLYLRWAPNKEEERA